MTTPEAEIRSRRTTRRTALKALAALAAGTATGVLCVDVAIALKKRAKESGVQTGNAATNNEVRTQCESQKTLEQCFEEYRFAPIDQAMAGVISPAMEEATFRAWVSTISDRNLGLSTSETMGNVLHGARNIFPTRREFLVGLSQASIFSLVHNITSSGIDTRTVPLTQFFMGNIYWALQRRLGFFANFSAHCAFNLRQINMQNNGLFKYR